jgi:uncharacterized protein
MNFPGAEKYIIEKLREGLPGYLKYHDLNHTLGVLDAATAIATEEQITSVDEMLLLKTAALYHDCGFLNVYDHHEEAGARIASEVLPSFGYSANQINMITRMIIATMLPQQPTTHLERILCDADLDHLGREDFYTIGHGLYEEWIAIGRIHTEEEWNNIQINFLEKHTYWTKTSQMRRGPLKDRHLQQLRSLSAAKQNNH